MEVVQSSVPPLMTKGTAGGGPASGGVSDARRRGWSVVGGRRRRERGWVGIWSGSDEASDFSSRISSSYKNGFGVGGKASDRVCVLVFGGGVGGVGASVGCSGFVLLSVARGGKLSSDWVVLSSVVMMELGVGIVKKRVGAIGWGSGNTPLEEWPVVSAEMAEKNGDGGYTVS